MALMAPWLRHCGESLCACRAGMSRGSKDGLAYLEGVVNGLIELAAPLPKGRLRLLPLPPEA